MCSYHSRGNICDDREAGPQRGDGLGACVEQQRVGAAVQGITRDGLSVDGAEEVKDEAHKEEAERGLYRLDWVGMVWSQGFSAGYGLDAIDPP